MSYRTEIVNALEYTETHLFQLPENFQRPTQTEEKLASSPVSRYAFLEGQEDEAAVIFEASTYPPNYVFAKNTSQEELSALVQSYREVVGEEIDDDLIRHHYNHEKQHLEVARELGAVGCKLGIAVHLMPRPDRFSFVRAVQICMSPGRLSTTKLGTALIAAYPDEPSPDDLQDVHAMGYEGIDDIAERIIYGNKQPTYPLPRSYSLLSAPLELQMMRARQARTSA